MNLIFRMLYVFVPSQFRRPLDIGKSLSTLNLRVLTKSMDINFHFYNGRYLTICDLNPIDLFTCTGLIKAMFRRNWIPVIAEHTMSYKKPMGLFQRFREKLEVTHWDEKYFYMQHTFISNERVAAEGTSKGCVYACGIGVASTADVISALEQDKLK